MKLDFLTLGSALFLIQNIYGSSVPILSSGPYCNCSSSNNGQSVQYAVPGATISIACAVDNPTPGANLLLWTIPQFGVTVANVNGTNGADADQQDFVSTVNSADNTDGTTNATLTFTAVVGLDGLQVECKGQQSMTSSCTLLILTPPSVPVSPSCDITNSTITVVWYPPVDNGGEPVSHYTITQSSPGVSSTTTTTTATITDLLPLTHYTFTINANNSQGYSNDSAVVNCTTTGNGSANTSGSADIMSGLVTNIMSRSSGIITDTNVMATDTSAVRGVTATPTQDHGSSDMQDVVPVIAGGVAGGLVITVVVVIIIILLVVYCVWLKRRGPPPQGDNTIILQETSVKPIAYAQPADTSEDLFQDPTTIKHKQVSTGDIYSEPGIGSKARALPELPAELRTPHEDPYTIECQQTPTDDTLIMYNVPDNGSKRRALQEPEFASHRDTSTIEADNMYSLPDKGAKRKAPPQQLELVTDQDPSTTIQEAPPTGDIHTLPPNIINDKLPQGGAFVELEPGVKAEGPHPLIQQQSVLYFDVKNTYDHLEELQGAIDHCL